MYRYIGFIISNNKHAQHAEEPYVTLGAIRTVIYFGWFLVLVPVVGIIENTLMDIATDKKE